MAIQPDPPIQLSPDMDDGHKDAFINQNFQSISNFLKSDSFKIVSTVPGTYTFVAADVTNRYANPSFAHGLTFKPTVIGSFISSTDDASHQLPYNFRSPTSSYYSTEVVGGDSHTSSAAIEIHSIDTTNINISIKFFDILGLSWLAANTVLTFKFYCLQETIAS